MLQQGKDIAPSVAWDIVLRIKRSGGLSVNEICAMLKMSYMGVKQHCDALKKRGYLDTWRRPKPTGRPEKLYRPTSKLDAIFPQWSNEMFTGLLAMTAQIYGETAPERLLHHYFLQKTERLNSKLRGQSVEARAKELSRMRISEGWLCSVEADDAGNWNFIEHHNPMGEIARLYPAVIEMETRMISALLNAEVERVAEPYRVIFKLTEIGGVRAEQPAPPEPEEKPEKSARAKKARPVKVEEPVAEEKFEVAPMPVEPAPVPVAVASMPEPPKAPPPVVEEEPFRLIAD